MYSFNAVGKSSVGIDFRKSLDILAHGGFMDGLKEEDELLASLSGQFTECKHV